jgi:hypothetical protein
VIGWLALDLKMKLKWPCFLLSLSFSPGIRKMENKAAWSSTGWLAE